MTARTARRALTGALVAALAATALTTTAASAAPTAGQDRQDRHAAFRTALKAQVTAGVPGVLGQARDEHGTWNGTAGVADRTTGEQRRAEDRFRAGSITKAFVSVVLLQLEAEGKLDIDDTVDRHLPGVVRGNGHDGRRITIRQLLNHTSGIYNYTEDPEFVQKRLGPGFPEHRFETVTPRQLVATAMKHEPYARPGKLWHYSNTNYILAGMIVEKVTGRPYASEIDKRVLRRVGMRATTFPGTSPRMPDPSGRAYSSLGETGPSPRIIDATELNPSWGWAAGEMITTAGDLNRFYRALMRGELLPERQQRELLTTVPVAADGIGRYGLGVSTATLSCGKTVWFHGGGIHGSISMASATPDGRHTAAFNFNGDWAGDTAAPLEAEYCGTRPATVAANPSLTTLTALR